MKTMTTRTAILLRMTDLEVIQLTVEHIMQLSLFLKHYFQTTHVQGCTRRLLLLAHVVDASLEWLSVRTLVSF